MGLGAETVKFVVAETCNPFASVTDKVTMNVPASVEVQLREAVFDELQPVGRPPYE